MNWESLKILGIHVAGQLVVFVVEAVDKKVTYELKYSALFFLKSKISDLIETPASPVTIVSGVFVQIFEETSFLSTAVDGSPTLFRKGFKMIFGEEVQYKLHSIVIRGKEKRPNVGDILYGSGNGAVSSLMDDNLHQTAASEFRKVIYKQLLLIISEKLSQLEWDRGLLLKAEDSKEDKF